MSPSQLNFIGKSGEIICQNATIKSDVQEIVLGKILFAKEGFDKRELNIHNLTPNQMGINVVIPEKITLHNENEIEICINGNPGNYHGVLLYRMENKPIRIGIWIQINISGTETISITNIAKEKIDIINSKNVFNFLPIFLGIILLILLGIAKYRS